MKILKCEMRRYMTARETLNDLGKSGKVMQVPKRGVNSCKLEETHGHLISAQLISNNT